MKTGVFKRVLTVVICGLLLCVNVPAQLTFGRHGMRPAAAPTLRNRTRLSRGLATGRPLISFVSRVGGVAFDATAKPAKDLKVTNMTLAYSAANADGERLTVTINDQPVSAPIYDWQLIPIAKFVASDFFSCFTLFGDLTDARQQRKILMQGGRILNYHPAFVDTLMGLRLFQLDSLIIGEYPSWDLVKDGQKYLLGAGEQPPDTNANKRGWDVFEQFEGSLPAAQSYVISDRTRNIFFSVNDNKLNITGEPSYYFWSLDTSLFTAEKLEQTKPIIRKQLIEEATKAESQGKTTDEEWVVTRIVAAARSYERFVGDPMILLAVRNRSLLELFIAEGDTARKQLLQTKSLEDLIDLLILVRALNKIQYTVEIRERSDKVSNRTDLLRAINPAVWDAGVTLLRYGAFFRYYKTRYPKEWQAFMRQVRLAPKPLPYVTTPTILEGDPSARR